MKIFKKILLILMAVIIVGAVGGFFYFKNKFMSAPANTLTVSNLGTPFDFKWVGMDVNGTYEKHIAMYVPLTIPGVDRTFYMQFDTGAPSTVLYYNSVLSINEKYGDIFRLDTVDNRVRVVDAVMNIGSVNVEASEINFRVRGTAIDWSDSTSMIKIGTVGSDFMEKNPLIMDFENQQITLKESLSESMVKESDFLPLKFEGRKVFLSAELNNKPISLWFDSGSSAFELIVEEDTFNELAVEGAERVTYTGNSWGNPIKIHNIQSEGEFDFGSTTVPLTYVTFMDHPNKLMAFMMKASNLGGDLGGMTGNKLFLDRKLVLDAPNLRYTVLE